MAVRASGFERVPADLYQTPAWVLHALAEHVVLEGLSVWEPACGGGQMVRALIEKGASVLASDIQGHGYSDMALYDFTCLGGPPFIATMYDAIVTNPPYGAQGRTAERFIRLGINRLRQGGLLALLLQADFDSAGGRRLLFRDCPHFAGRVVLNRRIEWFPRRIKEDGSKEGGPSANHTWFIWQRRLLPPTTPPFTLYAPAPEAD